MYSNLHPLQQNRPYLVSQFVARKKAKKHAESKKSKGKSQVASCKEAVTLALRNRIVP